MKNREEEKSVKVLVPPVSCMWCSVGKCESVGIVQCEALSKMPLNENRLTLYSSLLSIVLCSIHLRWTHIQVRRLQFLRGFFSSRLSIEYEITNHSTIRHLQLAFATLYECLLRERNVRQRNIHSSKWKTAQKFKPTKQFYWFSILICWTDRGTVCM